MSSCGKKTEIYSRITGYFRPVANWNDAKQQEFKDRKVFSNITAPSLSPVEIMTREEELEKVSA